MFSVPIHHCRDTGSEQYWRLLGRLAGQSDEVLDAGDVGFERVETEVEINLPLIV